jgi:hypothetical protein
MKSISCMANAAKVRLSTASIYHILTNSLGKRKFYAKWTPHVITIHFGPCEEDGSSVWE